MLTSFSLSNFKAFKNLDPIELKPLTVLCGINNSGKSSIVQSLLLMKQSNVDNRQIAIDTYQEPVIFNGTYVRLGDWVDVIHRHAIEQEMGFSWKLSGSFEDTDEYGDTIYTIINEVEVKLNTYTLDSENLNSSQEKNKISISSFIFRDLKNNFSLELTKSKDEKYLLKLSGINLRVLLFKWIYNLSLSNFSSYTYNFNEIIKKFTDTKFFNERIVEEVLFNNVQVKFAGIWPTILTINNFSKQSIKVISKVKEEFTLSKARVPKHLLQFIEDTLRDLNRSTQKKPTPEKADIKNIPGAFVDEFPYFQQQKVISLIDYYYYYPYQFTVTYFINLWSGVRYIGPLREAPKRFYFFDDLRRIDIGIKGENTPLVLALEQEQKIPKYYRCIYEGKRIKDYEMRESDQLIEAVNWWLSECMKLPEITSVVGLRGVPAQVKLNSGGLEVYLPDVGFGVSQILPIIVECLRTQEGETIVLEQPEIHLHPSLQSRLADFLICMAKSGKKIVVETHSEHFIYRLCLRIAQEETGEVKELLNTLFVSFDEQQQTSVVQPIKINEFGEIENWPVGFFDENDARELMAATLNKRMAKSKEL